MTDWQGEARRREAMSPERSVRLLRAKAGELENLTKTYLSDPAVALQGSISQTLAYLNADIALIASLLADHIEQCEQYHEPRSSVAPHWTYRGFVPVDPDAPGTS